MFCQQHVYRLNCGGGCFAALLAVVYWLYVAKMSQLLDRVHGIGKFEEVEMLKSSSYESGGLRVQAPASAGDIDPRVLEQLGSFEWTSSGSLMPLISMM